MNKTILSPRDVKLVVQALIRAIDWEETFEDSHIDHLTGKPMKTWEKTVKDSQQLQIKFKNLKNTLIAGLELL